MSATKLSLISLGLLSLASHPALGFGATDSLCTTAGLYSKVAPLAFPVAEVRARGERWRQRLPGEAFELHRQAAPYVSARSGLVRSVALGELDYLNSKYGFTESDAIPNAQLVREIRGRFEVWQREPRLVVTESWSVQGTGDEEDRLLQRTTVALPRPGKDLKPDDTWGEASFSTPDGAELTYSGPVSKWMDDRLPPECNGDMAGAAGASSADTDEVGSERAARGSGAERVGDLGRASVGS